MSIDKLLSHFCETPSTWGKQNTPCSGFAKGSRFLNMLMTFTLTPLSHHNSIIEPHASFLFSLSENLSFDLPSHFITSISNRLRRLVISSSFYLLSRGSFANSPSPFMYLLTTPPSVSLTPVLFDRVRLNFDRNGHVLSLLVLQLLLFLPPLLLLPRLVM